MNHRKPVGSRWRARGTFGAGDPRIVDARRYLGRLRGGTQCQVISSLELAAAPSPPQFPPIPQWHLSACRFVPLVGTSLADFQRLTDDDLEQVRRAFGLEDAEEDNHEPGNARHLWMPVDAARRVDCECKADEVELTTDGHTWTNTVQGMSDPLHCRACRTASITGRPCPLHQAGA